MGLTDRLFGSSRQPSSQSSLPPETARFLWDMDQLVTAHDIGVDWERLRPLLNAFILAAQALPAAEYATFRSPNLDSYLRERFDVAMALTSALGGDKEMRVEGREALRGLRPDSPYAQGPWFVGDWRPSDDH